MKSFRLSFICCFALLLILAASDSAAVSWKSATIEFTPTGTPGDPASPGSLLVNSNNNGCTRGSGDRKGCVRFAADDAGIITFALIGQPKPKACASAGIERVITKIELTDTDAGTGPSDKGDFTAGSYPLPDEIRDDAFPELDIDTGVVYQAADVESGLNRIKLSDINSHDATLGVQHLWYRVTVSRCSDGKIWVADPRLENDGMN